MSVLGCGLIGGSVALSWKKAGLVDHVVAFDINEENLKTALEKKVADECTLSLREAVEKSDIVVVVRAGQGDGKRFCRSRQVP